MTLLVVNVRSLEKRSNQPKFKEPRTRSPKTFFFNLTLTSFLLISKYTKHKLTIVRCQSQRLIWRRSESYNVLLSYNENKINKYKSCKADLKQRFLFSITKFWLAIPAFFSFTVTKNNTRCFKSALQ